MMNRFLLSLFFCIPFLPLLSQTAPTEKLWTGRLHVGTDSLKLVLVLHTEADSLTAVLDSPDQYVTDLPVDSISLTDSTLFFKANRLQCSYSGKLRHDGKFHGTFKQRGAKLSLTLEHTTERTLFNRPQEPRPPYPYQETEIEIPYNGTPAHFTIHGTLTLPKDQTPHALAILISGSGWQDCNETVFGHKPFLYMADRLTRAGYAVFRYDDPPQTVTLKATTLDFADITDSIIRFFQKKPNFENVPIGLIGHSEGSLVAWMSAARTPDIAFTIALAGPAIPLSDISLDQCRILAKAKGTPEPEIKKMVSTNQKIYEIVRKANSPSRAGQNVFVFLQKEIKKMSSAEIQAAHLTPLEVAQICATVSQPWTWQLYRIQPERYLRAVRCPILALNGNMDCQVNAAANLNSIARTTHGKATIMELSGLNHLFQPCETGLPDEYGRIEITQDPDVCTKIIEWLENL